VLLHHGERFQTVFREFHFKTGVLQDELELLGLRRTVFSDKNLGHELLLYGEKEARLVRGQAGNPLANGTTGFQVQETSPLL
jgi:hypothetical protein